MDKRLNLNQVLNGVIPLNLLSYLTNMLNNNTCIVKIKIICEASYQLFTFKYSSESSFTCTKFRYPELALECHAFNIIYFKVVCHFTSYCFWWPKFARKTPSEMTPQCDTTSTQH